MLDMTERKQRDRKSGMTEKEKLKTDVMEKFDDSALVGKCIDPKQDFAFKMLFGREKNKRFLISLLNGILDRKGEDRIVDLVYNRQEYGSLDPEGKLCRFDIMCTAHSGEKFQIEMQKSRHAHFEERMIFYSSLLVSSQGRKGAAWLYNLKPVYTIAICTDEKNGTDDSRSDAGDRCEQYVYDYRFTERNNAGNVLPNSPSIMLIDLDKFRKDNGDCGNLLDKWLFLLKFVPDINPEELHDMFPDEILKDFIDEATYASLSAEDKISYIKAMYADMDRACEIEYAENKGEEKGRAEEKQEMAKKMIAEGLSLEMISRITGLTVQEIGVL